MRNGQQPFPIDVRTGWVNYSPALRHHASQRVRSRLAECASQIRSVTVRCSADEPQTIAHRHCEIEVTTTHAGPISASSVGVDLLALVDRAVEIVAEKLRQRPNAQTHAELGRRIASMASGAVAITEDV